MASRKEQKEALRAERERKAREAEAAERRRRLIGFGAAGVLAVAAIAAIVAVIALGGGGGGDGDQQPGAGSGANVPLPAKRTDDLQAAVKAAGCTYKEAPEEAGGHLDSPEATFDDHKTNPPTSGTHSPSSAPDGVYEPGNSPTKENWLHTMEHGRVIFMYKPGTEKRRRDQLETLMNEPVGDEPSAFKTVLMENNTKMPFAAAAVSWTRYVGCPEFNDRTFDALRAFRIKAIEDDVAPEGEFPWPANE